MASTTLRRRSKHAGEQLDFDISFADWLAKRGDLIDSFDVTIEGPDAALAEVSSSAVNGVVKVWVAAGTPGRTYTIVVLVTTSSNPQRKKRGAMKVSVR
jgi:hypothetical protein